jgi:hypothetical protein
MRSRAIATSERLADAGEATRLPSSSTRGLVNPVAMMRTKRESLLGPAAGHAVGHGAVVQLAAAAFEGRVIHELQQGAIDTGLCELLGST